MKSQVDDLYKLLAYFAVIVALVTENNSTDLSSVHKMAMNGIRLANRMLRESEV